MNALFIKVMIAIIVIVVYEQTECIHLCILIIVQHCIVRMCRFYVIIIVCANQHFVHLQIPLIRSANTTFGNDDRILSYNGDLWET